MPRFIVLLVLGYLIYRLLKRVAMPSPVPPQATTPALGFSPIAACAICGVHVLLAESVTGQDGRTFCSDAHCRSAHAAGR